MTDLLQATCACCSLTAESEMTGCTRKVHAVAHTAACLPIPSCVVLTLGCTFVQVQADDVRVCSTAKW